ncbi:type I restriction-modification system subunit M [Aliarcobacter butzleri]|nr:type I restriction-modification system subunit M [Aliarcobacter butzleri]
MNLSSTIKSIQDIMRKDDGVDGDAQRIGQLTWMLFLKIYDQKEDEWAKESNFKSIIPEQCRWRNWATYTLNNKKEKEFKISSDKLVDFIMTTLFPTLKAIDPLGDPKKKVVKDVFSDSYNYMRSGTLIQAVIEKLEDTIDFNNFKTRQNLGDLYEQILNDLRGAGNSGEFYTPRAITQFMVEMINPQLKETVLDPACGTGGFLTASIDHLAKQAKNDKDKQSIENSIRGFEKKKLPHLLCTTNMLLHGIDVPSGIEHRNTLSQSWDEWSEDDIERYDCVISNPPFGGAEDDNSGDDYPIKTRETADMFMILIINKLLKKDGGRCAVVLPNSIMFGDGIKAKIKKELLEKCNLHTIIRLPKGVFNPYTSIESNLLFFTRGKPTETIWYYEHPYPNGYKSYSKTKPIKIEEFEAEKNWWGLEEDNFATRKESEFAWKFDFKSKKEEILEKAKPYKDKKKSIQAEIIAKNIELKNIKILLKNEKDTEKIIILKNKILEIEIIVKELEKAEKDAQSSYDRIYSSMFNLDQKNPNTIQEDSLEPEKLIKMFKEIQLKIESTEQQLKDELFEALEYYFQKKEV